MSCCWDQLIIIWNWKTGEVINIFFFNFHDLKLLNTLKEDTNYCQCLCYLNDGLTLVNGAADNKIRVWKPKVLILFNISKRNEGN